jgi:ankyrin repeat protein
MKIKIILTAFALMAATGLAAAATNDVATLVQRGLFEEEANHQLDAAIRNYREAIEQFDHDRPLAATAIFRLGECYRKQGKTNEASAQYERIVREFPDQTQLAQLSQGCLPAPAAGGVVAAGSPAMPSDEAEFLRKVIESAQTSPDLVNQQLSEAAGRGYMSAAQFLIAHGADVNTENKGIPAIIEATVNGNEAMVQLLLSHGADVNARDSRPGGGTALIRAVQKGFMAICRTLVVHGADVNATDNSGSTPLHAAVGNGHLPAAEFLITNKAQIDPRNNDGETPLSIAVLRGHSDMVKLLLANHADANVAETHGETPLLIAIERVNSDMVKLLLDHGADANVAKTSGETPLAMAIGLGNNDMVKLLLAHHANANVESSSPPAGGTMTPLGWATSFDHPEMVKMLLQDHADPNAAYSNGETPLLTAIRLDKSEIAKLLLDNHADANMEAVTQGWSYRLAPLLWAIQHQRPEMVKLLLEHQADPNAVRSSASLSAQASFEKSHPNLYHHFPFGGWNSYDSSDISQRPWAVFPPVAGETPLMFAATEPPGTETGQPRAPGQPIGLQMPGQPITPQMPGQHINTPRAPERNGAEMAQLLLDHGAKPNAADPDGWTALIYAIEVENSNTVRTLIEHGADVNILDKQGRPPLAHISTSDTGRQIEALLIKAGADADYNRRRGIWTYGPGGTPKTELFQCPTNSINHYTLLEFLATLYEADAMGDSGGGVPNASYAHYGGVIPFPDFARITIHRLDGKRAEVLHVNVAGIFKSGDCSKDVALQAGDLVEIPEQEHKVAEKWYGLSATDTTALNKCLWRTARVVVQGKTNDVTLVPSFANAAAAKGFRFEWRQAVLDARSDWLGEALNGRKVDTIVRSFLLNKVVRDANVLVSTWDLSRVQLTRGGAKMTFDLTAKPPPEVWLENGDVIEIPELPEGLQPTEAK